MEVFESSSRKLIEEEDPNAESIILQMEQAMQEHLQKRLNLDAHTPIDQTSSRSGSKSRDVSPAPQSASGFVEAPMVGRIHHSLQKLNTSPFNNSVFTGYFCWL